MITTLHLGTLKAAVNIANLALVQIREDGSYFGPSADIAHKLSQTLSVAVEFIPYHSASEIVAAVDRNEWDIAFLANDPSRTHKLAFSKPYLTIEASILVRDVDRHQSIADLNAPNVRVSATRGAAYEKALSQVLPLADLTFLPTPVESRDYFLENNLDAIAGVRKSLEALKAQHRQYSILKDSFASIQQCVAVPLESAENIAVIESALFSR